MVQKEPTGFTVLGLVLRNLKLLDHHGGDLEPVPVDGPEDLKLKALDIELEEEHRGRRRLG